MNLILIGRCRLRLCATVLLLHHCIAPTVAAPFLDQSYIPPGLTTVSDTQQYAQTFTSTLTGMLARVDVNIVLVAGTDTVFEIRAVSGGVPVADDSQTLASL